MSDIAQAAGVVEIEYANADDEDTAMGATYANQALNAVYRVRHDDNLMGDDAFGDPWAQKVVAILDDVLAKLTDMAEEECLHRPGLLVAGKARVAALKAERRA